MSETSVTWVNNDMKNNKESNAKTVSISMLGGVLLYTIGSVFVLEYKYDIWLLFSFTMYILLHYFRIKKHRKENIIVSAFLSCIFLFWIIWVGVRINVMQYYLMIIVSGIHVLIGAAIFYKTNKYRYCGLLVLAGTLFFIVLGAHTSGILDITIYAILLAVFHMKFSKRNKLGNSDVTDLCVSDLSIGFITLNFAHIMNGWKITGGGVENMSLVIGVWLLTAGIIEYNLYLTTTMENKKEK